MDIFFPVRGPDLNFAMTINFWYKLLLSLDAVDGTKDSKALNKTQNSIRIMKEKIALLSKRGKKLVKKEKKLRSNLDKFKGKVLLLWGSLLNSILNITFFQKFVFTFTIFISK